MRPFGLRGDFFKNQGKYKLPNVSTKNIADGIAIYGLDEHLKRVVRYVNKDYPLPDKTYLPKYKLFLSRNQGSGVLGEVFSAPILAGPNSCCTETFVSIGLFNTQAEALNCYKYICTKFFRVLVGIKKNDQSAGRGVYEFVPMQDFTNASDINWTLSVPEIDEQLYKKYNFSEEEISFIESMIKPMDLSSDGGSNE